jgi:Na+-transporting NADH:ubiquinone oxidoreductase subunit NqrF
MSDDTPKKKIRIDTDFFGVDDAPRSARVTLLPDQVTVVLDQGESIFEAAKRVGVFIPSECGGKGTCGRCRVRFPLPAREATYVERQHVDRADLAQGVRLSCRSRPSEDLSVTVLPERRR